jgi:hypothetical protein
VGSAGSSGLILRWNGTQWNSVSGPTLVPLGSVSALSSNDVWVTYVYSSNGRIPSHWDGSSWTSYEIYNANNLAHRSKVKAITHDQAWILRTAGQRISAWPVFSHWTGHTWNSVAPQNQERRLLYDLDGVEPHDVYAVGYNSLSGTLIEHWDGYNWSIVPSPGGTGGEAGLQGVVTLSSSDAWAVGYEPFEGNLLDKSLVAVHFDGQTWDLVDIPDPGQSNLLHEVDALSSGDVWAVGEYSDASGTFHPLAMHYTAPCANPIPTSTPAPTATPEPPPCPGETFTDVCPSDYFYTAAKALADDGIIAGYNTSPPCNNELWIPCFKPYNTTTRGQISKVVSLAANFTEPVSGQTFEDVTPGSTFYEYIERMAAREIISGYPCGGPGEPCGPGDRPYFRPGNNVTRGQLSKMTAQAFGWSDPVTGQSFEDVPPDSNFYDYVERLYNRGIINGYECGSPGEPCVLPGNLPYFRPNSNVLRGQTAKIVNLARTQPTTTPTAEPTSTPTAIVTAEATATPVEATATTGPNRQPTR